ncbi:MAG: L-rhamnose isomerase [Bryobacteraceae bacterium]|nr:MAG: L-rhamnose isomerase [Bryobacteraceae bacterium]
MPLNSAQTDAAIRALDSFAIELPSWGFANTGTRFGKFIQLSAATTTAEKIADAAAVHRFTGCCPSVAVHVLWDFPGGVKDVPAVMETARKEGVRIGAINPNVFQDQCYKHGSFGNPDPEVRRTALQHVLDSIEIQKATGSRDLSLWFADGISYPGSGSIRARRQWFVDGLKTVHAALSGDQRMLVEYKPFEPAFYATDIADWGMAYIYAKHAGPRAKVLVDTGHHYQAQNIEQIVAWLLAEDMLGGFHFNDRRYADDDLTLGCIDPYQVFRIFHEICYFEWETGRRADIAYMVDQSHNLKNKIEETIQTANNAQELYVKAAIVDHARLRDEQMKCNLVDAEECLREAFFADVRPVIAEWRKSKGLPADPLDAFRQSGYTQKAEQERAERNRGAVASYA